MEDMMKLLDANGEATAFLHIHLAIFLDLDPRSLKSARLVCKEWSQFIKSQLWMDKKMRKRLQSQREAVIIVQKIMLQFQVDFSLQTETGEVGS